MISKLFMLHLFLLCIERKLISFKTVHLCVSLAQYTEYCANGNEASKEKYWRGLGYCRFLVLKTGALFND